jgi:hypothetical protein
MAYSAIAATLKYNGAPAHQSFDGARNYWNKAHQTKRK